MAKPVDNEIKTRRLIFTEWISTLTIFVGCFVFLFYRMDRMESNMKELSTQQTARTDKLYEMFIDLVKEGKS